MTSRRDITLLVAATLWTAMAFGVAANEALVADAAMRNDIEAVRALVGRAADVNAAQGDGMTALHWAARNEQEALVEMLLHAGANVRATTRLGAMTPLWMAAQTGNARIVEMLLDAGADPDAATTLGVTPLMMASAAGSTEAIAALAARGAAIEAKEATYEQTPLIFAAAYNQPAAIRMLVELGASTETATQVRRPAGRGGAGRGGRGGGGRGGGRGGARGGGGAPAQQSEQEAGAAAADSGGRGGRRGGGAGPVAAAEAAEAAAAAAAAEAAVAQAPQPAGRGAQAAEPAAAQDGTPAESQTEQAAEDAPRPAQEAMGGLTPLLYAARQGHREAVEALLDSGANINGVSGDGTTPLMIAVINGHFDLAMRLLERGADPTLATVAGGTPLYRVIDLQWAPKSFYPQPGAVRQQRVSYLELMQALLDRGADPNARLARTLWYSGYGFELDGLDAAGATPFWRAAQAADLEAMKLLVAAGADPHIPTREGVTPLLALAGDGFHGNDAITVPGGRMPAVRYLVEEHNADVNAVDERGGSSTSILHTNTRAYTALHAAAARGDNEMILYLVSKGARVDMVGPNGLTTADMANGPRERIQPFPETIALLVSLGAKNNNRCVSC